MYSYDDQIIKTVQSVSILTIVFYMQDYHLIRSSIQLEHKQQYLFPCFICRQLIWALNIIYKSRSILPIVAFLMQCSHIIYLQIIVSINSQHLQGGSPLLESKVWKELDLSGYYKVNIVRTEICTIVSLRDFECIELE